MGILNRKPSFCSVCKQSITHKHKPKREWDVEEPLCGDCYVGQMQKYYDLSVTQKCVMCSIEKNIPDLWEPKYPWEMKGLLCKTCFDKKDTEYNKSKTFCGNCDKKLGIIRYNSKRQWALKGQLCRECWDSQKAKLG
ncbi:MAG: hypothetical protein HY222_00895 [Thaumarchaeota archaeon]|nr:hypothetical protein [Nitrososphaerota archaeon]MBI3640940.1 hypothetical protein [Nitrososphaerota archaeon]